MDQYGDGTIEQFITRGHINRLFAEMTSDRGQEPWTVAAYISAYLKFLKWLLLETKITPVHFQEALNCLSGIKTSVYKQRKQREGRLEAEADELLTDSQDIDTFNRLQYPKNLRQKFRRTDRQGKIDQQTHDDIRNYLMLEVVLPSRQRASAVANMTVENQIRARKQRNSEGEDMRTMLVSDHKTVTTYGASTLAFNTELFTDLTFYTEEIRARPLQFDLSNQKRYLKGATLAKTDKNEDKESTTSDGTASTSSQMWSGIRQRKRQNPTEWTDTTTFFFD
ncbi:hypothetical protein BSL78_25934 [Apostichopus japonicus]|uniref:Uncharacterized protein n=1 Tax=Stichopus japonicus TaxID=307972 RepID=A0A2G8JNA2_STIJA|nr:hypothetical protein BSL78_25934 [Apostichopus japonicus]